MKHFWTFDDRVVSKLRLYVNQEVLLLLTKNSRHGCQTAFQVCTGTVCGIAFEKLETSNFFYVSERYFHVFDRKISLFGTLEEIEFYVSWGIFWAMFFSSENVFYHSCLQRLDKNFFRFPKKISTGLAILHPISFDEYSDVSFWRESTLIKVSSFEEKEQKTFWIYSKSPPFFLRTAFFFSRVLLAFFWNKIQTHNLFRNLSKKTRNFCKNSPKSFQTAFHISKETMKELIASIKSTLDIEQKAVESVKISNSFFKIDRDDHQFLTEKKSTGMRNCNRGVRVWLGRFQSFSEGFQGDCGNCILRNFSGCFLSRQDFFHQKDFQSLRKNLQTFDRLSAWLTKVHPICPKEQFEVMFWKKIQSNKFFWNLNKKLSEFCGKTLGKVVKFSSVCPEVHIDSFFWKILIWI